MSKPTKALYEPKVVFVGSLFCIQLGMKHPTLTVGSLVCTPSVDLFSVFMIVIPVAFLLLIYDHSTCLYDVLVSKLHNRSTHELHLP